MIAFSKTYVDDILSKAQAGVWLSNQEMIYLLELEAGAQTETLYQTARNLRRTHFGHQIFIYGFLYISTYCRNDCQFCFFRRSNTLSTRYRKKKSEILSAVDRLAASGIHLIDLTMGEDPILYEKDGAGFDQLVDLVYSIKRTTDLPVMVSPGVIPKKRLTDLHAAGATWYACYQETHSRRLFDQLRPGQLFDVRMNAKIDAHEMGFLIEEGLLCGVGEKSEDIAHSFQIMRRLNAEQVRVMNFVPQPGTPMVKRNTPSGEKELRIIALMRLLFPNKLIPASLDINGIAGLKQRLNAGANVVTSLVPAGGDLLGVARRALDIENGQRSRQAILPVLTKCGLEPAPASAYLHWVHRQQTTIECGK